MADVSSTGSDEDRPLVVRGFAIDAKRREVRTPSGELAVIRPKALELLLALAEQAGHVVPKEALIERVWPRVVVTEDSLTQLVNEIRRLFGDTTRQILKTVPRRGYLLSLESAPAERRVAMAAAATNVPLTLPTLYGRDGDLAAVDTLMRQNRLVTITGTGGIGKTRLAWQLGRLALPRHAHGVWVVDLAARAEAADVLPAVATAAGIEPTHGDTLGRLLAELSARDVLLILDNCERLAQSVSAVAASIISATPNVRILTTSQVPLGASGEVIHRLNVLSVPPEDLDASAAAQFGAFQLFIQRIRDAGIDAEFDASSTAAAIDICRRLDGVPLALEMAAARVPVLGLDGVRDRLGERLRLLRAARLQVPPRHETLRATLEWSCALLSEPEAKALRRLSVMSGLFEVDVARQMIAADDMDEWAALDALCGLVDKSLVRAEGFGPVRYRMLESTRMLAREKLEAAGELAATLARHAAVLSEYGRIVRRHFMSLSDEQALRRCEIYVDDLDRVLDRCISMDDVDRAAQTLVALRDIDRMAGDSVSMERRLHAVHPLLPKADGLARARLMTMYASCGWFTVKGLRPVDAAEAAVTEWRDQADAISLSHALLILATERARLGQTEDACAALREGIRIAAEAKQPKLELIAKIHAGHVSMFCGQAGECLEVMMGALTLSRSIDASRLGYYVQAFLPGAALMAGQKELAVSLGSRAVRDLCSYGQGYLASASESLVLALLQVGDIDRARAEAATSLPLAWAFGMDVDMASNLALYAARTGRHSQAAQLHGYVSRRLPAPRNALHRWRWQQCDDLREEIESALGSQALQDAHESEAAHDTEAAFELAARLIG